MAAIIAVMRLVMAHLRRGAIEDRFHLLGCRFADLNFGDHAVHSAVPVAKDKAALVSCCFRESLALFAPQLPDRVIGGYDRGALSAVGKKHAGARKIPFYMYLNDQPLFAFAGLYDEWHDPTGTLLATYTIITTEPNDLMATVHNRMPAIISPEHEERWLTGEQPDAGPLKTMLAPYPAEKMVIHPVSPLVNTPSADDERVVRPVASLNSQFIQ